MRSSCGLQLFRSLRAHQRGSDQMKILKDQSAHTTTRVVGVEYRLWLPFSINIVLNLTKGWKWSKVTESEVTESKVTESEVRKEISNLSSKKATKNGNIPAKILKKSVDIYIKETTFIINDCTPLFLYKHEGKFPPASIMTSFSRISGSN